MADVQPEPEKRSRLPTVCVVLVILCLAGGYCLHRLNQGVRNAYAVWWVADLVVEHMKANNNQWPTGWDDLRDDYQTCTERSQPFSFDELSGRTQIDWQAIPSVLVAESKGHQIAKFRVITLTDGTESHWEKSEPNQIVLDYLRSQMSGQVRIP
ncbi:MAG: hypothetical protein MK110_11350 [Fuerstiella sp.]|nr:hypothetical protein [Fuerstiella sp.]